MLIVWHVDESPQMSAARQEHRPQTDLNVLNPRPDATCRCRPSSRSALAVYTAGQTYLTHDRHDRPAVRVLLAWIYSTRHPPTSHGSSLLPLTSEYSISRTLRHHACRSLVVLRAHKHLAGVQYRHRLVYQPDIDSYPGIVVVCRATTRRACTSVQCRAMARSVRDPQGMDDPLDTISTLTESVCASRSLGSVLVSGAQIKELQRWTKWDRRRRIGTSRF